MWPTHTYALDGQWPAQLFAWLRHQEHTLYLTSNGQAGWGLGQLAWLAAVGSEAVTNWNACKTQAHSHIFGLLSYDLKNVLESKLHTTNPAPLQWPELALCAPTAWLWATVDKSDQVHIQAKDPVAVWQAIHDCTTVAPLTVPQPSFNPHCDQASYIASILALQQHIVAGDVYEVNLAQAFSTTVHWPDPLAVWQQLNAASPMPMAGFFKFGQRYVLCASPERFVHEQGGVVCTQPIKGTTRRGRHAAEDEQLRHALQHSPKERAENVMIVDLARNDLNRVCVPGTVQVLELFGTRTYTHLHHLVSTITGQLAEGKNWCDVVQAAFPPGSMTGAPKISAMQLIDHYEGLGRGAYAGSLGFVHPTLGTDFNVVIRSVVYDAAQQLACYHVGGAITYDSRPQAEYDESLLKAQGIIAAFA